MSITIAFCVTLFFVHLKFAVLVQHAQIQPARKKERSQSLDESHAGKIKHPLKPKWSKMMGEFP